MSEQDDEIIVLVNGQPVEALSVQMDEAWSQRCDQWQFSIALRGKPFPFKAYSIVQLLVNGIPQITGYLEDWEIEKGVARVRGRDFYAAIVDSGIPPNFKINEGETPAGVIAQCLALKGLIHTTTVDVSRPLKQVQTKMPATIADVMDHYCKRNSLVPKMRPDGKLLQLLQPDFVTAAKAEYFIFDKNSNQLSASYAFNVSNQPNVIVGLGSQGGGETERSATRAIMVNELVGYTGDAKALPGWAGAVVIPPRVALTQFAKYFPSQPGPQTEIWIEDKESTSQTELETHIKRKMASYTARALQARISVRGVAPPINSMVAIEDTYNGFSGSMWIAERSWSTGSGGCISNLVLQLPYSAEI